MKKKQLFAVLLAGSMTVGMAPAAAFAAEDTGAVTEAEAPTADENTETPDDGAAVDDQSQSEADAQAAAQAQAEAEAQAAAQAQAEAEAQAAAQAQAEAQAAAQAQAEAEAQAAAQAQAEEAQQEQQTTAADATVTTAAELQVAINNAPDFAGSIDDSDLYTSAYKILISASFNLTDTITVPANKNIAIFGATNATTVVGRGSVAGDMFKVSAGSILSMTQNEGDGSSEIGKLSVEGKKDDETAADGSIVSVEAGAKFVMTTGVTLSKNVSTAAGAAVKNSGKLVITGGEIKDNVSTGGAVYSTGTISLEQGTDAAAGEPKIIENYTSAEKSVKSNIVLGQQDQSAGSIIIAGAFENQNIGYSVENPAVDYTVFQKPESLDANAFAKAVNAMSYEGDQSYGINTATGQLVSNRPTVNIDNPTSKEANTVSVTFTSDKAGTYYYKYVAKGAEAPTIETATEGGTVKAGETTSLKLTKVTDKTIDLYVWVKESESGNAIVGEGVRKDIAVTQAQNPVDPKPAAPKVKKISAESKTATTAEVVLQSDKSGKCYYKWVAKGAKKPSISTTKDSKDSKVAITAKKDCKINLKNLEGDAIDLYVQVVAKDGSKSAVTKIATVTLKKETVKTPAKISNISYRWKTHTSANVTMRSNKAGQYYYAWVIKGSATPKINTKGDGTKVSANKDFTINLQNLNADNAIDVYVSIKGTDGTVSTPKKIALDEAKRPANVKGLHFEWTSHTSATAEFLTSKSGKLYYAWTTRDKDGNSDIPDIYNSGNSIETGADSKISIYLNNLDPDNAIDLYVRFKEDNGIETIPLKVSLKEENRPVEGHDPKLYKASESRVYGLENPLEFYPNTFYEFRVVGAGTDNNNPGEQDVKWVPLYWSTSANPSDSQKHSTWKIGSGKGINKEATYNLYVFFQKYVYTGGQWQAKKDAIESAVWQFTSAKLTPTGTPGADGTYGTGGQTGSDPDATITGEASATSSNGGNGTRSKNAVSTADNSPIGTMSALAVASLLAGGYVIVRRRKKDI